MIADKALVPSFVCIQYCRTVDVMAWVCFAQFGLYSVQSTPRLTLFNKCPVKIASRGSHVKNKNKKKNNPAYLVDASRGELKPSRAVEL